MLKIITLSKTCSQTFPRQMNNTLLQHHHILHIIIQSNRSELSLMYFMKINCRKFFFFVYSTNNLAFQNILSIQIMYTN